MEYHVIHTPDQAPQKSHLIARTDTWLPACPSYIDDMRQQARQGKVADCSFGCAPFSRITLLPDDLWQDNLTDGLQNALRPLLATPASTHVMIDCTTIHRIVMAKLIRYIFNLEYTLAGSGSRASREVSAHVTHLTVLCPVSQLERVASLLHHEYAVVRGMIASRSLADMPSEQCTPQFIVEEAQRQCDIFPALRCEVLDEKDIVEQGLGALYAVGKGASHPPRLLAIHYDGKNDAPVRCYVGKGITFDTGGLWLKAGPDMYTMKYDMSGASSVLGLMLTIAELALPVRVMGVLALAENAIGPDAMQPGCVVRACNGMTVEINNTDAEGRLVLLDAIAWASQRHPQARYLIDMATLTGAVVKALGYELSGLMTRDESLRTSLTEAGIQSGDEVWPLPLDARLEKQIVSVIADVCNTPPNNAAISSSAAWLLHHFCPPAIPWAHLDISGSALWRENGRSTASGRPVPLLVQHLLNDI